MKSSFLIVTGYSGAGKSSVLKALEDIGYFCVDNLPIPLLPAFFEHIQKSSAGYAKVALGIDVRGGDMVEHINALLPSDEAITVSIFFLTASTGELLKRFQETRRRHPLCEGISLTEAIEKEKNLLKPLMNKADLVVDTGNFSITQLRTFVRTAFAQGGKLSMVVNLMSFGFKYGVPQECNYIYDVRSLPNPHFIPALKALTGQDEAIRKFLFEHPQVKEYWDRLTDFFYYSIKKSYEEGRSFIHVSIGCTGGKHRSVAFAEELAKKQLDGVTFLVHHRDISRE